MPPCRQGCWKQPVRRLPPAKLCRPRLPRLLLPARGWRPLRRPVGPAGAGCTKQSWQAQVNAASMACGAASVPRAMPCWSCRCVLCARNARIAWPRALYVANQTANRLLGSTAQAKAVQSQTHSGSLLQLAQLPHPKPRRPSLPSTCRPPRLPRRRPAARLLPSRRERRWVPHAPS